MDEQLEVALRGGEFKRLLESQFGEIRKKYALKRVDIEVLYFLSRYGEENTPTDIYRRLKLNRGHVSQAIDNLIRRNLIEAIPDEEDRRYVHYRITKDAAEVVKDVEKVHAQLDKQVFKGVSKEELQLYKKVTEKIFLNIREMLG